MKISKKYGYDILENIINKITPIKDINPNIVYSNSVNKLLPDEPPKTIYVA